MRKVTTINLNGRAYQLEEQGYDKLHAYLKRAETSLADDPDKREVIADIEQAIADKCERLLRGDKNVVTTERIADILKEMGEVESDGAEPAGGEHAEPKRAKRLYTIREGSVILGVCRGLGAYFGIEPNLVRVAFVILAIITHGFGIALYILLGIFLPSAKTDTEIAEAYGDPTTAQEIVDRAREKVQDPETMAQMTTVMQKLAKLAIRIVQAAAATLFGIITAAWLFTLWGLTLGNFEFHDELAQFNGLPVWLAATATYLIIALPVLGVARILNRVAEGDLHPHDRKGFSVDGLLAALWGIAVVGLFFIAGIYGPAFRNYADAHDGKVDMGDSSICVDANKCNVGERYNYHY
jgi:phage shock protein PspC (stress-responsive transcriptional regulator)